MKKFPDEFKFGVSTSAYQTEGAWNEDGKGENIWDSLIHTKPDLMRSSARSDEIDISCDGYHKFKEDIKIIRDLELQVYRISLSWSRILPNGNIDYINERGVEYYNRVIDEIIQNGIEPMVTLYHFDLPQKLQDFGGWCNPLLIDYFADYAKLAFQLFGSKVKLWTTFNEPGELIHGYVESRYAPYLSLECFDADLLIGHHILKAHAKVYHIYRNEFKSIQQGKVSINLSSHNFKSKTESKSDKDAEIRARQFSMGWFAHPIYSKTGDYPPIMKELIGQKSAEMGKKTSILPKFTEQEILEIRGSADFFALNHYTSSLVSNNEDKSKTTYFMRYANAKIELGKDWPSTAAYWFKIAPWGIREMLRWIKDEYDNPPVYITENGFCDTGEINDHGRITFFRAYLEEVLNAIWEDNCNIIGYNFWTLLDCFEWLNGFDYRFGIVHVNFDSPRRERTPKLSADFVKILCASRSIPS